MCSVARWILYIQSNGLLIGILDVLLLFAALRRRERKQQPRDNKDGAGAALRCAAPTNCNEGQKICLRQSKKKKKKEHISDMEIMTETGCEMNEFATCTAEIESSARS